MGLRSLEVITRSGRNHSRGANAIASSEAHQLLRVRNYLVKVPSQANARRPQANLWKDHSDMLGAADLVQAAVLGPKRKFAKRPIDTLKI